MRLIELLLSYFFQTPSFKGDLDVLATFGGTRPNLDLQNICVHSFYFLTIFETLCHFNENVFNLLYNKIVVGLSMGSKPLLIVTGAG